jgi:phage-related protein
MILRRIRRVNWDVLAVCDDRGGCQLLDFLGGFADPVDAAACNMLTLIARTCEHGPSRNTQLYRDLGDGIFEMKKSGLRVLFFYDAGRIIVCSHVYKKQGQKLGHGQKERASDAKERYFAAKKRGDLEIRDS